MISVNNILKQVCKLHGLGFAVSSNICAENLFGDALHLNDDWRVILANNFIYFLTRFIF